MLEFALPASKRVDPTKGSVGMLGMQLMRGSIWNFEAEDKEHRMSFLVWWEPVDEHWHVTVRVQGEIVSQGRIVDLVQILAASASGELAIEAPAAAEVGATH